MEHNRHPKLGIEPLAQPSSAEVGELIRSGLACRTITHEGSPIEAKQQSILERYIREENTLAVALIASGASPQITEEEMRTRVNAFVTSDRATQKELHHDVISRVDLQLSRLFGPNLTLCRALLTEAGKDSDALELNMNFWNRMFKNASRRERVNVAVHLREGNNKMLLERFPSYAQHWEKILIEKMGLSKEEAGAQRIRLEENFTNASNIGKVGISKTLREKILETSEVGFNFGITTLRKLRAVESITVDSEQFPDPSRLSALYQASTLEGRIYIDNLIKEACDRLIAHVRKSKHP